MVKFIISTNEIETSKYTREYDTYGVGEELLYPIEMNVSKIGQKQPDANLASYLINRKTFQKSDVIIEKRNGSQVRSIESLFIFS